MTDVISSPLEVNKPLSTFLGIRLLVKRDDLLPFPLAGNKVRKLRAELDALETCPDLVVSNGAITSNHCRTLALMGAERGIKIHLVLHGNGSGEGSRRALRMLADLNATVTIVGPLQIAETIASARAEANGAGMKVHVINGGCHTPAGAIAYRDAAAQLLRECTPSAIVVASGTGATQGGIVAAASAASDPCEVIGISVARSADRGTPAVREAARWAGASMGATIAFIDDYRDGGYGVHGQSTDTAVRLGWAHGLPLDSTYTGKAFRGLLGMLKQGRFDASDTVVFWHTGGLANYLLGDQDALGEVR